MYPRFVYHPELARDGRMVNSAEQEPREPGWVDTPEKFDPNYVAPPPTDVVPGSLPVEAIAAGFRVVPYPSHRYNAKGDVIEVKNAEEDEALDPSVWKDTPDPAAFDDAGAGADGASSPSPAQQIEGVTPQDRADFYATSVDRIKEVLEQITKLEILDRLDKIEAANPEGTRPDVRDALNARRKVLRDKEEADAKAAGPKVNETIGSLFRDRPTTQPAQFGPPQPGVTPAEPPMPGAPSEPVQANQAPMSVNLSDKEKTEFLNSSVATLVEKIDQVSNPAVLDALERVEAGNPKGARTSIQKALTARRRLLQSA